MKKLNNKGMVSFSVMVGFLCIFIIFLLIVAILAYRFGVSDNEIRDNQDNFVPDTTDVIYE